MNKYLILLPIALLGVSACNDFLDVQPEHLISENNFYETANDFETALIGNYATLQELHNVDILYLTELTTDNAEIQWTSPTQSEMEFDELNVTPINNLVNAVWNDCFTTISRSNNVLSRLDGAAIDESLKSQYAGEARFLRAYCYFYMVRLFGEVPIVEETFRSPGEVAAFDMTRQPVDAVYALITDDLTEAADLLAGVSGLSKSRASEGAAQTLLGKVYLTRQNYPAAAEVLKEVIDANVYSLQPDYQSLFTNGNDELPESIFEIKYLSGNVGEGNAFSSVFTPPRFDMAIFPGNLQGTGRIVPTADVASAYEPGDERRAASIADSVLLIDGTYAENIYGRKFVDFTTGLVGDGGINFTALRYADVLLMYAEALNALGNTEEALIYLNRVRERAGLAPLRALSAEEATLALERERRVEFLSEGHRWFDLVRTGRARAVMNDYFASKGLTFTLEDHELVMPVPQEEIDIDPNLAQNTGY